MTVPTKEQIDAAIKGMDWHGHTSSQYLDKNSNTILFALRFLREMMGEPEYHVREAGYIAMVDLSREENKEVAAFKAMRDKVLEKVENG